MKKRLEPRELELAYLIKGICGVAHVDKEKTITPAQIKKTISFLEARGVATADLEDWLENVKGEFYRKSSPQAKSKTTPRVYKTFTQGTSPTAFVKIPVSHLGVKGRGVSILRTCDAPEEIRLTLIKEALT